MFSVQHVSSRALSVALMAALAACSPRRTGSESLGLGEEVAGDVPPSNVAAAVRFRTDFATDPRDLSVRFSDGIQTRTATFSSRHRGEPPTSPWYRTAASGSLHIAARVADTESPEPLAIGELSLPLRPDWAWALYISVRGTYHGPPPGCIRCPAIYSFPLRPGAGRPASDSLFIEVTGTPISKPLPPS